MDAKALAKSKRAHSLHHSKHHHPSSKAKSASVKKAADKLPSNWDRFELDAQELPTSHASDTVAPKSKGADFAFLLSEAKSQSAHDFCFADEVLDGVHQGQGPLLFAEGQRMLSSILDYSFPFGENETRSQEESFFSLDFQSLAKQLSKASLMERLFIDPDVIPPQLLSEYEGLNHCHQAEDTSESASYSISNKNSAPTCLNQLVEEDFLHSGSSREKLGPDVGSVAKRPSMFEATSAESELDMLLDSFSETKLSDSTSVTERQSYTKASVLGGHLANMGGMSSSLDDSLDDLLKETSNNQIVSRSAKGKLPTKDPGLDESLDDLLKETSNRAMSTTKKAEFPVQEVNAATSHGKAASSKSKILDDFDSWFDSV